MSRDWMMGEDGISFPPEQEAVCERMGRTPPWAKGLKLRADGYECEFYQKD